MSEASRRLPIRPVAIDEFPAYAAAVEAAFGAEPGHPFLEVKRAVFEPDRSLAAFDGDRIVATAGAFSFRLHVPGGEVPSAAVTAVAVAADHRRRGLLTALMRRQLDDVRARGEPVAFLWASEGGIYGRFGYGLASLSARITVSRRRSAFRTGWTDRPRDAIRLVGVEEACQLLPPVYDAARAGRPGTWSRSHAWWRHRTLADLKEQREGAGPLQIAVAGGESRGRAGAEASSRESPARGYVCYRIRSRWDESDNPDGTVLVPELAAVDVNAARALWRHVLDLDLCERVVAWHRPLDDELPLLLADPAAVDLRLTNGLWVRLVDVPTALRARRYHSEGRVVLRVADPLGDQSATWRLEVAGGMGTCEQVADEPAMELDVGDLGALYLAGMSPFRLARAGRIIVHDRAALATLDRLLAWPLAPWAPEVF